ncbi:MAG: PP2C family protein-serine/threonine phosphatase [Nocardioides sp.]
MPDEHPAEMTAEFQPVPFRLGFAAVSDIGRMRKDNQDSGYAGPWLLAVCDGVGGAARGDLASATAIEELRSLDRRPSADPRLDVRRALAAAHTRISGLIKEQPGLSGTSTTAVLGLFDGELLTIGHIGDSRAYLLRAGELDQLTHDHTFVQALIDEGRLTEAEARVHPNRNLILKALDGVHDSDPDIVTIELAEGDRILLCSDGACGVLDDDALKALLAEGSAEQATHTLITASLDAGSTDNITCVVADVVDAGKAIEIPALVVGAVALGPDAERAPATSDEPSGGELEGGPDPALPPGTPGVASADVHTDPEHRRYAPRPPRRFLVLRRLLVGTVALGLLWVAGAASWSWTQRQYYVGEHDGNVTIFRGVNADVPLLTLSGPYETTDMPVDELTEIDARDVKAGIASTDLTEARRTVDRLAEERATAQAEAEREGSD